MESKYNFIKTSDEVTKKKLLEAGLEIINESNGCWTFLNASTPMQFDLKDVDNKIAYSNVLTV